MFSWQVCHMKPKYKIIKNIVRKSIKYHYSHSKCRNLISVNCEELHSRPVIRNFPKGGRGGGEENIFDLKTAEMFNSQLKTIYSKYYTFCFFADCNKFLFLYELLKSYLHQNKNCFSIFPFLRILTLHMIKLCSE